MKKRALLSVSDKAGIVDFAKALDKAGYEIISTGGTAEILKKEGLKVLQISDVTGFPECLDGRVKTLHPAVHAGLLYRRDLPSHVQAVEELGINSIDVVVVNLYPFKQTVLKGCDFAEAVENIDIGGPTMLRSAAKNYRFVTVVVDPADYGEVIERINNDTMDERFRMTLMYKVYAHTAVYDSMISAYLASQLGINQPQLLSLPFEKKMDLRYGENPNQTAAFYTDYMPVKGGLGGAEQLQGKELSFNNINDLSGAIGLLREFTEPCAVAVKHANPCGVACGEDIFDAYAKAYECDPVSIFGGIVALNRTCDEQTASKMVEIFLEIVAAPDFTEGALEVFKKKPNLRVMRMPEIMEKSATAKDYKRVPGGLLVQDIDLGLYDKNNLKTVTEAQPSAEALDAMEFAYKVVKHVKSNAIVLAKGKQTVGIGAGQTNRIWAAKQAIEHAGDRAKGAVLASDAFFPFNDCAEAAAEAGISAIIQPGGSIRDNDSIELCNKHGLPMVFTGERHFKH
ncbi:MAG: bifunctional phosphoribosylaminoimidazolecarboxamide formyltransferase/IMP cyclohydrolase [Clostridia bacterium]|nr:bifunctional phosphoribosylaminoimidazolecarboxamide formyltransferase/IMP cyclohydrolase [Clostridia bacterium]